MPMPPRPSCAARSDSRYSALEVESDTLTAALEALTARVAVRRGLGGAVSCG